MLRYTSHSGHNALTQVIWVLRKPTLDPVFHHYSAVSDLDDLVVDGDHTRHHVHDPLRIDHHLVTQKLVVKMLQGAQLMEEAHRLVQLQ